MFDATEIAILGGVATGLTKLWVDLKSLASKHMALSQAHTECQIQLEKQHGEITALRISLQGLERDAMIHRITPHDALVVANEAGIITEWSAAASALFGFMAEETVGRVISSVIVPPDLVASHNEAFAKLMASPRTQMTHLISNTRGLKKSGREFPVDIQVQGWKTAAGWVLSAIFRPTRTQVVAG